MAKTKVRVLWVEMRWKPPLGPSLPGYLYRDAESTALDKRTPAQLRRTLGQPPMRSMGSCVGCGDRIFAATGPEWSRATIAACPACGRRPW